MKIKTYSRPSDIKSILPLLLKNHLYRSSNSKQKSVAQTIFRDVVGRKRCIRPEEFKNYSYQIKKLTVLFKKDLPVSWALLVNEKVKKYGIRIKLHRYTKQAYRNMGLNKLVCEKLDKNYKEKYL